MTNLNTEAVLKKKKLYTENFSWSFKPLAKKDISYFQFFFFLSKFLYMFFKLNFFFVLNLSDKLSRSSKYRFFSDLTFFFNVYGPHFKAVSSFFFFFSKYFFFFLLNRSLHWASDFLYVTFSNSNRLLQFRIFRLLICINTFIKNFLFKKNYFKGTFLKFKGKLSWKALSRKKKTVYHSGKVKKSDLSLKASYLTLNLRTITGAIGLNFTIYF